MELRFTGLKLQIQSNLVNPNPLGKKGLFERNKVLGTLKHIEIPALSSFKIFDLHALVFQNAG